MNRFYQFTREGIVPCSTEYIGWYEIYRLSKAAHTRGAFAIQCRNPVLLGWLTLLTAVTACIHFSPLYRLTGTG